VIEPGLTPLKQYQLLSEEEFMDAQDEYGEETSAPPSVPKR
jgi:DNA-directed RNA polymerase subunit beta'